MVASGVTHTAWADHGVLPDETFHYLVRALDDGNGSQDSNTRTISGTPLGVGRFLLVDHVEGTTELWLTAPGSSADSGTEPWTVVDDESYSGSHSWFCSDEPVVKDQVLQLAQPLSIPGGAKPDLWFWHAYSLDWLWDGGRLEYSVNGGVSWHDILDGDGAAVPPGPDRFVYGGYTGVLLDLPADNPLAGEATWTGGSDGWGWVIVDLADFSGRSLLLRWRLGCNSANAYIGWWVDDLRVAFEAPCGLPPRDVSEWRP
jgi:hypothetical protein